MPEHRDVGRKSGFRCSGSVQADLFASTSSSFPLLGKNKQTRESLIQEWDPDQDRDPDSHPDVFSL